MFPPNCSGQARRKLLYLHDAAKLDDLRVPLGNHLEAMKGEWKGFFSIRINRQWRIVFAEKTAIREMSPLSITTDE